MYILGHKFVDWLFGVSLAPSLNKEFTYLQTNNHQTTNHQTITEFAIIYGDWVNTINETLEWKKRHTEHSFPALLINEHSNTQSASQTKTNFPKNTTIE